MFHVYHPAGGNAAAPVFEINTTAITLNGVTSGLKMRQANTTDTNFARLNFTSYNTSGSEITVASIAAQYMNHTASAHQGDLLFATTVDGGGTTERMRIVGSGGIGIGTSSPASLLNISGRAPSLLLSDSGVGATVNGKHWFLNSSGGVFSVGTTTNTFSATSTYQTITNKGNVGFGTTSPSSELSVQSQSTSGTTTVHLGTGGSTTNGSCFQMYAPNGTAYRVYVSNAGAVTAQAGTCE